MIDGTENSKQPPTARLGWLRRVTSGLLMVAGVMMLIRGFVHSIENHLGAGPFIQTAVVGALVFGLGLARWRFWRDR